MAALTQSWSEQKQRGLWATSSHPVRDPDDNNILLLNLCCEAGWGKVLIFAIHSAHCCWCCLVKDAQAALLFIPWFWDFILNHGCWTATQHKTCCYRARINQIFTYLQTLQLYWFYKITLETESLQMPEWEDQSLPHVTRLPVCKSSTICWIHEKSNVYCNEKQGNVSTALILSNLGILKTAQNISQSCCVCNTRSWRQAIKPLVKSLFFRSCCLYTMWNIFFSFLPIGHLHGSQCIKHRKSSIPLLTTWQKTLDKKSLGAGW